jgi:hypothetical protein
MQSGGQNFEYCLVLIGAGCYVFWIRGGFRKGPIKVLRELRQLLWNPKTLISLLVGVFIFICLLGYFCLLNLWTGGAYAVMPP